MGSTSDPKAPVTGYPAVGPNGGAATATAAVAYPYPAPLPQAANSYSYYAPQPGHAAAPPVAPPPYYPPAYAAASTSALGPSNTPLPPPPPRRGHRLLRRRRRATLILWLVLRPRLPQFSVSSASVSSFNLSSSSQQLSADFDVTLTVRNPNKKMGVQYDGVRAAVVYGGETISETSLPPFYQSKGNVTTVHARLVAAGEYVGGDVTNGINSDRSHGNGAVRFQFRVLSWAVFNSGGWRTRRHVMRVYCEDVSIGFNNSTASLGSLLGRRSSARFIFE
uniref:Late embryogenesis abundant protein LEA-2 subgroup domain-containing protein n=1 Tax=Ananas comosus var. bracteatus TaxID=296719 RepID=A0A6V7QWL2_ANACO